MTFAKDGHRSCATGQPELVQPRFGGTPMKRALPILIACVIAASADAQTQDPRPSVPGVRAPITFVMDTVLFRLPRAELSPTALVTVRASAPVLRVYSRGPFAGYRR